MFIWLLSIPIHCRDFDISIVLRDVQVNSDVDQPRYASFAELPNTIVA